jgi:hypothetical protein
MNAILDTNIYRGYKTVVLEQLLKRCSVVPVLSPLNVLEILGLDGSDEKDFSVRRAAAQKMLSVCQRTGGSIRWIEDPEVFQAKLLGCDTTAYDFGPWETALNRLAQAEKLADLSAAQSIINYKFARTVRQDAYKTFVDKLKEIKKAYDDWFEKNAKTSFDKSDTVPIFAAMESVHSFSTVRSAEFKRVWDLVREMQKDDGTAIKSIIGTPDMSRVSRLNPYIELYIELVVQYVATGKIDKNDFGDLQFAIYCGGGYTLLTNEQQWPELADRTSLAGLICSVKALEISSSTKTDVQAPRFPAASSQLLVGIIIGVVISAIATFASDKS